MTLNMPTIDEPIIITLAAGHAAYGFRPASAYSDNEALIITWLSPDVGDDHEYVKEGEEYDHWKRAYDRIKASPHNWLGDEGEDHWETIVELKSNRRYDFLDPFKDLAASLTPSLDPSGYTPGGDDDFFDYYPSGMRLLREFAIDLDELFRDDVRQYGPDKGKPRYDFLGVYFFVVSDFIRREYRRWTGPTYEGETFWGQEEVDTYRDQLMEHYNITTLTDLNHRFNFPLDLR